MNERLRSVGIDPTVNVWTLICVIFAAGAMYYRVSALDAKLDKVESRVEQFAAKNTEAHFEIGKELAETRATVNAMKQQTKGIIQ